MLIYIVIWMSIMTGAIPFPALAKIITLLLIGLILAILMQSISDIIAIGHPYLD